MKMVYLALSSVQNFLKSNSIKYVLERNKHDERPQKEELNILYSACHLFWSPSGTPWVGIF